MVQDRSILCLSGVVCYGRGMKGITSCLLFLTLLLAGCQTTPVQPGLRPPPTVKPPKGEKPIPVIDTHIHLWDPGRPEGIDWPGPDEKVLYRPVLPADFMAEARTNRISAAVVVEASGRILDNNWVLNLTKNQPRLFPGYIGHLPVGAPEFPGMLDSLAKSTRFKGIRLRNPPEGGFDEAAWRDLGMLADKGLTLDVLVRHITLEEVDQIAERLPKLKILLNHVAGAKSTLR